MTGPAGAVVDGSPAVDRGERHDRSVARWVERRIGIIWALLVFNALGSLPGPTLVAIPRPAAQALTSAALLAALLLSLGLNRRLVVRPNMVLGLATALAVVALVTSVRMTAGPGGVVRSGRLGCYLAVLWLLTPWWGRRDLLLVRCHLRALTWVSVSVLVGLALSPSVALSGGEGGRLVGTLWTIPAPQVAGYAAIAAGLAVVLWLAGSLAGGRALLIGSTGLAMVALSQTRTAMIGLVSGVVCAALSLLLARRRVRRVVTVAAIAAPVALVALAPTISMWFTRNQSSAQLSGLTGRKRVWDALLAQPRPDFNRWFGFGLSDKSFNGLPVDSTWLAVYHDQGLVGDVLVAALFLFVFVALAFCRPGAGRAVATFIVVYCAIASYTEVGLGDVSPYLLAIVVAASVIVHEVRDDRVPGVRAA